MTIPGSGNMLEDAEDDRLKKEAKSLPCGCHKKCGCDTHDERFDQQFDEEERDARN